MDYVQTAMGGGVASPASSNAFTSSSGHTVVMTFSHDLDPSTVVSVTDSYGNAYYRLLAATSGGPWPTTLNVFYATNITGGDGHTITATFPPTRPYGQDHCRFIAQEFTGVGVPERLSSRIGNTVAISSGETASTNQAGELVVASVAVDSQASTVLTEDPGWGDRLIGSGRFAMLGQASRTAEGPGPQEATWTLNEPRDWAAGVVAFAFPLPAQRGAFFEFL